MDDEWVNTFSKGVLVQKWTSECLELEIVYNRVAGQSVGDSWNRLNDKFLNTRHK